MSEFEMPKHVSATRESTNPSPATCAIVGASVLWCCDWALRLVVGATGGTPPGMTLLAASGAWLGAGLIAAGVAAVVGARTSRPGARFVGVALAGFLWLAIRCGRTLFDGPRASALPLAGALPWIAGSVVTAVGVGVAVVMLSRFSGSPRRRRALEGLGFMAACATTNAIAFPNLYPAAHEVLVALAALGALHAALAIGPCSGARVRFGVIAAAVAAVPSAMLLATREDVRVAATSSFPTLGVVTRPWLRVATLQLQPGDFPSLPTAEWPDEVLATTRGRLVAAGLPARPNVVVVTIDALRADRVGCAGGKPGLTPTIDRLGERGAVFTQAHAPATSTFQALTAMMTARRPDRFARHPAPDTVHTLADMARSANYTTYAGFPLWGIKATLPADVVFTRWDLGFEHVDQEPATDQERVTRFGEFARAHADRPFVAWLHLMAPHAPYEPRDAADACGDAEARYDGEVRDADRDVGRILEILAEAKVDKNTIVIVTADHGEDLGEHGSFFHGSTVYEAATHVPLVIHGPGVPVARVDAPVTLLDLRPTVAHMVAVAPEPGTSGRSVLPLCFDPRIGRDRIVLTIQERPDHEISLRAVIRWPWKLIRNATAGTIELFDLAADPGERTNRADEHADLRRELLELALSAPRPDASAVASRLDAVRTACASETTAYEIWWPFLSDSSSAVRGAAVDALSRVDEPQREALLRLFAAEDGPATEDERQRALRVVNRRPRIEDLQSRQARVRLAAAAAMAEWRTAWPAEPLAHALDAESDRAVCREMIRALIRTPGMPSDEQLQKHAGYDDPAGAVAAFELFKRWVAPDGTKRAGAPVVTASEVVLGSSGRFDISIQVPAGAHAEAATDRIWVAFLLAGDASREEISVRAVGRAPEPPVSVYRFEAVACATLRQEPHPVTLVVTGARSRPAVGAAFATRGRP